VYHLFVSTQEGSSFNFDISRVIREYTDDAIKQKYKELNETVIAELCSFPAIFAWEEGENSPARVGFIKRIRQRNNNVRIDCDFSPGLPDIPANVLSKLGWELEFGNWEMNRTHWAIKDVDLFKVLHEVGLISNKQVVQYAQLLKNLTNNISSTPSSDQIVDMPAEDKFNSGLILLMLLAQTYYRMLENVISISNICTTLDMELNQSYFWVISNIEKLLKNHKDLNDFPISFEPLFEDLYPTTVLDADWQNLVAPKADYFLSAVQKYANAKGIYDPDEGTPAWIFVELFRPSINLAIERSANYKKRVLQHFQVVSDSISRSTSNDSNNNVNSTSNNFSKSDFETTNLPKRNSVFISYSHKDKKFLDELYTHLKPLEREGRILIWSDLQIKPGSQWLNEIEKALASTKVAVLLVTKDFLASDFIYQKELCPLLQAAKASGVAILWILISDCIWKKTALEAYQAAYPPDTPLDKKRGSNRNSAWVEICEKLEKIMKQE
jgi:hypothetical protein